MACKRATNQPLFRSAQQNRVDCLTVWASIGIVGALLNQNRLSAWRISMSVRCIRNCNNEIQNKLNKKTKKSHTGRLHAQQDEWANQKENNIDFATLCIPFIFIFQSNWFAHAINAYLDCVWNELFQKVTANQFNILDSLPFTVTASCFIWKTYEFQLSLLPKRKYFDRRFDNEPNRCVHGMNCRSSECDRLYEGVVAWCTLTHLGLGNLLWLHCLLVRDQ